MNAGTEPMLGVFVPGLMGAGILVSGGILLADAIRRLVPQRGLRRQIATARGVHGVVAGVARAAGVEVPAGDPYCRDFRSRWTYLALGTALAAVAALAIRAGVGAYEDPAGILHDNPWPLWIGGTTGLLLLIGAGLALVIAALHRRSPAVLRRLVAHSPMGRLMPPPEEPRERARFIVPLLNNHR